MMAEVELPEVDALPETEKPTVKPLVAIDLHEVQIMTACVKSPEGVILAQIERVTIGGGIRTIEGQDTVHPSFERFHVRLLSPDRMIPDELREAETYEEACELAVRYGAARAEHAAQIDQLAASLKEF